MQEGVENKTEKKNKLVAFLGLFERFHRKN